MLIHRLDSDTLEAARALSAEVAARLTHARSAAFADEAEADAYLWEVVALMQRQASVTARILTVAIEAKNAAAAAADEAGA